MGEYLFKCLERLDKIFDGRVLLTVLKEVASKTVRIRGDLDTNRIPESKIRKAIDSFFSGIRCDYVLLLDDKYKTEILVPLSNAAMMAKTVIFPRVAKLKGIQLLKRQERVELEANVVFSRSLVNESVNVDNFYYVFEGRVGLVEPYGDAVAVRILTDKGTRVILSDEHVERISKGSVKSTNPQPLNQHTIAKESLEKRKKVKRKRKSSKRKVSRKKPKRKSRTRRKRRSSKKKR